MLIIKQIFWHRCKAINAIRLMRLLGVRRTRRRFGPACRVLDRGGTKAATSRPHSRRAESAMLSCQTAKRRAMPSAF